jgi:hypothetical protein
MRWLATGRQSDMADIPLWCRVSVVGPDGDELARYALQGLGAPDLGAVDLVARLTLVAERLGGDSILTELSAGLRMLLELAGLIVEVEG